MKHSIYLKLAAAVTGVGLLTATGVTVADASAGPPPAASAALLASTSQSSAPHTGGTGRARSLLARAVWAQVEVRTKHGYLTVDYQRGRVLAVGNGRLTVRGPDGRVVSYLITSTTKIHRKGAVATAADIQPGDRVLVIAAGAPLTARQIRDLGPVRRRGEAHPATAQGRSGTSAAPASST